MMEMWDWYSKQKNIIDPIELKISGFDGEVLAKTFRVHKNILSEFLEFSKAHSEYKQQDLISQALSEFIKRYK